MGQGREINDPDRWTRRYDKYKAQGRITKTNERMKKLDDKVFGKVEGKEAPALRAVFRARKSGR